MTQPLSDKDADALIADIGKKARAATVTRLLPPHRQTATRMTKRAVKKTPAVKTAMQIAHVVEGAVAVVVVVAERELKAATTEAEPVAAQTAVVDADADADARRIAAVAKLQIVAGGSRIAVADRNRTVVDEVVVAAAVAAQIRDAGVLYCRPVSR